MIARHHARTHIPEKEVLIESHIDEFVACFDGARAELVTEPKSFLLLGLGAAVPSRKR